MYQKLYQLKSWAMPMKVTLNTHACTDSVWFLNDHTEELK
jgi:hypothetical protein